MAAMMPVYISKAGLTAPYTVRNFEALHAEGAMGFAQDLMWEGEFAKHSAWNITFPSPTRCSGIG